MGQLVAQDSSGRVTHVLQNGQWVSVDSPNALGAAQPKAPVPQELQGPPQTGLHMPSVGDAAASVAGHIDELPDFGTGMAKSVGRTMYGAGSMAKNTVNGDPLKKIDFPPELSPSNEAQHAGQVGGDIAQMFIPGAVAGKLSKLPMLAEAPGVVRALLAAGTEGVGTGLLTKAQTGDTDQALQAGALGTAAPLASSAMEAAAPALVNRVLRPRGKELSFGRNPGQGIVDEGIMAPSMNSLDNKVGSKMDQVGQKIDSTVAPYTNTADVTNTVMQPIGDAINKAMSLPRTNEGLINELGKYGADVFQKPLDKMTPSDILGLKRDIAGSTRWTGSGYDKTVNQAKVAGFGGLKDKLTDMVPETGPLNERYANLAGAKNSVERNLSAAPPVSPWLEGAGLLGGLGTGFSGNENGGYNAPRGIMAGAGLAALAGLTRNPGVATVGAQMLRRSAPLIEAGKNIGLGMQNTPNTPSTLVPMIAPDGTPGSMPADQVDNALANHYRMR